MAVIDNEGDDPKNTEKQQNTPMFHRYKEIRRWLKSYKLHRYFGWKPSFKLEDGLSETISWYKEFLKKNSFRKFIKR